MVLKKLGVLKKGHLVEVQRSDLVAGAIGQTALKTREKITEGDPGVIFMFCFENKKNKNKKNKNKEKESEQIVFMLVVSDWILCLELILCY
jgi:hypothetical protein